MQRKLSLFSPVPLLGVVAVDSNEGPLLLLASAIQRKPIDPGPMLVVRIDNMRL